jgi:hypothetical protein
MQEQIRELQQVNGGALRPPAYPFRASDLFGELHSQLEEEHRGQMSFERLGKLIGKSTSTTHHWFQLHDHPNLMAFMCLLEWLPPTRRHAFIDKHCRFLPLLEDARLAHAPGKIGQLLELLRQKAGLTIVTGHTDFARTFLLTALGHAGNCMDDRHRTVAGLDLNRPVRFIPVAAVLHLDPAMGLKQVRNLAQKIVPSLRTSASPILLFNGVWSSVPELRENLIHAAGSKHVILAEAGMPDLAWLKVRISTAIHVVTLSATKVVPGGIRIHCRRVKIAKRQQS